ncbi:hypothetical protein D3C77_458280 [compost metagenome]
MGRAPIVSEDLGAKGDDPLRVGNDDLSTLGKQDKSTFKALASTIHLSGWWVPLGCRSSLVTQVDGSTAGHSLRVEYSQAAGSDLKKVAMCVPKRRRFSRFASPVVRDRSAAPCRRQARTTPARSEQGSRFSSCCELSAICRSVERVSSAAPSWIAWACTQSSSGRLSCRELRLLQPGSTTLSRVP